jgi:hypothetical protein
MRKYCETTRPEVAFMTIAQTAIEKGGLVNCSSKSTQI